MKMRVYCRYHIIIGVTESFERSSPLFLCSNSDIVVCSSAPTIRVNGEAVSQEIVKSRFLKLTDEEIDYVLYALHHNSSRIGNMRSYLITTLYNSKSTVSNYYANMAYNDIREGVI